MVRSDEQWSKRCFLAVAGLLVLIAVWRGMEINTDIDCCFDDDHYTYILVDTLRVKECCRQEADMRLFSPASDICHDPINEGRHAYVS